VTSAGTFSLCHRHTITAHHISRISLSETWVGFDSLPRRVHSELMTLTIRQRLDETRRRIVRGGDIETTENQRIATSG
jgi:hypothetical protein